MPRQRAQSGARPGSTSSEAPAKNPHTQATLRAWLRKAGDLCTALDEHARVAMLDPEGRITFVNDKFIALSGYARAELLGQDYRTFSGTPGVFTTIWRTLRRGKTWHGELQKRAKNGSAYWVDSTLVPIFQRGALRQVVALSTDISDRKRIEAELARKLSLQRLLSQLSARFLALPTPRIDAAIEQTQRKIVQALGLDRSTLWQMESGRPDMTLTHFWRRRGWAALPTRFSTEEHLPWCTARLFAGRIVSFSSIDDLPPRAARDIQTFRQHGPKSSVAIPLIANGKTFGALAFGMMERERAWSEDEIEELKLVAQMIGNVLARQRAEIREEQLRAELAHAGRVASMGELVAALAHELNQPLAAILSNAQAARRYLARGGLAPDEFRAILDDIVRDDKRAGSVIHHLRAMVSNRPVVRERCSINDLLREVVELMHAELVGEGVELRLDLTPMLPRVEAARVELQQVIVNFLLNALHAMKGTPRDQRILCLESRLETAGVTFEVHDTGHGIAEENQPHLFAPFFSTKPAGLGIGLSICRRIVEDHGGRITFRQASSGGAIFCVTLPIPPTET